MTPMCVCAAWILLWVVGYWCLTLLGWRFLAPLMTSIRQAAVAVGTVGLVAALLLAELGERPLLRLVPLLIGLLGAAYALRNQWLFPRAAVELRACKLEPEADALVAVLPGGEAVCVSVLSRTRTAVRGDILLVHCGLARSLAAFTRPGSSRPAAILPHSTGFEIGAGGHRWDGVDGTAVADAQDLVLRSLVLCSYSRWRAEHSLGALLAAPNQKSLAPGRKRTPRVPGSAAVEDPLAWGRVEGAQWTELGEGDFEATAPTGAPQRFLGRWAAAALGMQQDSAPEVVSTANEGNSG